MATVFMGNPKSFDKYSHTRIVHTVFTSLPLTETVVARINPTTRDNILKQFYRLVSGKLILLEDVPSKNHDNVYIR